MRRQLALLAAAITSLVLVAFLVPLALLVRTVAADRAVNAATSQAQSLTPVVATADRSTLRLTLEQLNATAAQAFTVFLSDGSVLGAPAPRTAAVRLAATGRSFTVATAGGRQILVSVQGVTVGSAVIATFVPGSELRRGVARAWLLLAALGVGLVVAGVVVADWLARAMVRPVGELSAVSRRLASGDLDARAHPAGPPEIREVGAALNHLAARIRDLLREEREAAADLSHRLRTPLTALRLAAEALRDPGEAQRVDAGIDVLERAVTQAISDTRRPATTSDAGQVWCDAAGVVAERVEFWSVLAEDTGRAVDAGLAAGPLPVRLSRSELTAAVDALLGNVFAHTPDGTAFSITLTDLPGGGARLVIADHGPGFPGSAAGGLLQRGASGAGSTGLGLDIVRRAAASSGGTLVLSETPGGGARATLDLGPVSPPSRET
ncbi:MAG: HAMP domain-containing protein [Micromonosporaceae bacterium]